MQRFVVHANVTLLLLHQRRWAGPRLPPELVEHIAFVFVDPGEFFDALCRRGCLGTLQHWYGPAGEAVVPAVNIVVGHHGACAHGHLAVVQWLGQTFAHKLGNTDMAHSSNVACRQGHLAIAEWLYDVHGAQPLGAKYICNAVSLPVVEWMHRVCQVRLPRMTVSFICKCACESNDLAKVQWLHSVYTLQSYEVWGYKGMIFLHMCKQGFLALMEWLHDTFPLPINEGMAIYRCAVQMACLHNHMAVAQWLCRTFALDATYVCEHGVQSAFGHACRAGHADLMRWLSSTFDLRAHFSQRDTFALFGLVCCHGCVLLATWFCDTFALADRADTAAEVGCVFRDVCKHGRLAVARWLQSTFSPGEFTSVHLQHVSSSGRVDMLEWAHQTFGLTARNVAPLPALHSAMKNNHLRAAQWLLAAFAIDGRALQAAQLHIIMCSAAVSGSMELLQWAHAVFGFTRDIFNLRAGEVFRHACSTDNMDMVYWLHATYRVDTATARLVQNTLAYDPDRDSHHLQVLTWLRLTFGPP